MFAVMIEGLIFIVMSLFDLRRKIFKVFPVWLMKSSMAGIGLFLAFIGLQAGNGVDIIRDHPAVLVDFASIRSSTTAAPGLASPSSSSCLPSSCCACGVR